MSMGAFQTTRYELNGAIAVVAIKVQPETIALDINGNTNDATTAAVTIPVSAYARKPSRKYGIGARRLALRWTTTPPAGYEDDVVEVPILQQSVYDAISVGDTGTYLGTDVTVTGKLAEDLD